MKSFLEKFKGLQGNTDLTQTKATDIVGTSQTMYARYARGAKNAHPLLSNSLLVLQCIR